MKVKLQVSLLGFFDPETETTYIDEIRLSSSAGRFEVDFFEDALDSHGLPFQSGRVPDGPPPKWFSTVDEALQCYEHYARLAILRQSGRGCHFERRVDLPQQQKLRVFPEHAILK